MVHYPSSKVESLNRRIQRLESDLSTLRKLVATKSDVSLLREGIDLPLTQLSRSMRRYEKKEEHLRMSAEDKFVLVENRLEDLKDELDILGIVVGDFFELLEERHLAGSITVRDLPDYLGQQIKIIGRFVTLKETRTIKRERMCFGTFLDVEGNWLDTVHFPPVYRQYPFLGTGFYEILGTVIEDFGVYSVEVYSMHKLGYKFGTNK